MTLFAEGDDPTHPDIPVVPAHPPTFAQRLRALTWASTRRRIASIVVGLFVIVACCGTCGSAINALAAIGATVTPDAQVSAPRNTATPHATATPRDTATATTTPTPIATATATATAGPATPTVRPIATVPPEIARIQRILSGHTFTSHLDSVTWDAAHTSATINVSVSTQWDKSTAVFTCKQVAYDVYSALYTSGLHPTKTTIIMMGPTQDAYGNSQMSQYMRTELLATNAALFHWDNLLPDQTWDLYDSADLALFLL